MSLTSPALLDFTRLRTPPRHGDVLIEPAAPHWLTTARANSANLASPGTQVLGMPLAHWRKQTREILCGCNDRLIVATGHQPGFIHPGVWAKHVVAKRLADASEGIAVNLVVDSDSVKQSSLAVPTKADGHLAVCQIPIIVAAAGTTYEGIPARRPEEVARIERSTRKALQDKFESTQMPEFFSALYQHDDAVDWVDQIVAARRAIEGEYDVLLEDKRVSTCWFAPFVQDVLGNALRFATSHNRSLAEYRRINCIRGAGRPIPDLHIEDDRCEVPFWAYKPHEPRRRVFAAQREHSVELFADNTTVVTLAQARSGAIEFGHEGSATVDDWRLRPRALALTIWARLFLADLFIHGIGGAKYDRISDSIIGDYYGIVPPRMVCASATLHLDLPRHGVEPEGVRHLQHALRDLTHNPERNLALNEDLTEWSRRKARAVMQSERLRTNEPWNRSARREAFDEIRAANHAMTSLGREQTAAKRSQLDEMTRWLHEDKIATGREYFLGLYDRKRLNELMEALPDARDFGV